MDRGVDGYLDKRLGGRRRERRRDDTANDIPLTPATVTNYPANSANYPCTRKCGG